MRRYSCPEPLFYARETLRTDVDNYLSLRTAGIVGVGLGAAAIMANTDIDEDIQFWYQNHVRDYRTDEFSGDAKQWGEGKIVVPILAGCMLLGALPCDDPVTNTLGDWGERSLRAGLIGTPLMMATQYAVGASRPGEDRHGSAWQPFSDVNGASGHAYIAAVPFITAAQMTDEPILKVGFYAASTVGGWSRINDDHHYASQVVLGWALAYAACVAVDRTELQLQNCQMVAMPIQDGVGVGLEFRR